MTPQMGAILGYVLERTYTMPALVELAVTPDDRLIGRSGVEGALGQTVHMGSASDLRANLRRLEIALASLKLASDKVRLNYCEDTTECLRYSLNPAGPFQPSSSSKRRININQTSNRGDNDERRSTAFEQPLGLLDGCGNLSDAPHPLRHPWRFLIPLRRGAGRAQPFRTGPRAPFFLRLRRSCGRVRQLGWSKGVASAVCSAHSAWPGKPPRSKAAQLGTGESVTGSSVGACP
jgi:hypothetical protein